MSISERISHILLEVSSLENSTKFYQEILGFEIVSKEKMKDGREVVVFKQGIGLTSEMNINWAEQPKWNFYFIGRGVLKLLEEW